MGYFVNATVINSSLKIVSGGSFGLLAGLFVPIRVESMANAGRW